MKSENLKGHNFPKGEAQKETARKGGIASGKAKRQRKQLKETINYLLSLDMKNEKIKAKIKELGVPDIDINNQTAMVVAIYNEALKGNVQAAAFLRDTVGEKPIEKQQQEINIPIQLINDGLD